MRFKDRMKNLSVACIVLGVTLEVACCAALRLQLVPGYVPTYAPSQPPAYTFWSDIDERFGVWHFPHSTYRHKKACFDVTYATNSAGARDRERTTESKQPRVVVLGDSFVEGFGVELGARLSDLLESATGVEHLNFGTSGYFGPSQYLLLYQSLAKKYRHDAVLVGLLPANDFDEDDLNRGKTVFSHRYRPYFVGSYPDYRLEYYRGDIQESTFRAPPETFRSRLRSLLKETSHAYNFYAFFRDLKNFEAGVAEEEKRTDSRYYTFTEEEILHLRYVLGRLIAEAESRPVTVFAIPTLRDLEWYAERGDPPLSRRLREMSYDLGFELVDLLPVFAETPETWPSYFHGCDGHWNAAGNAAAAEAILAHGRSRSK
jgi:hypothetical protein